MCTHAMGINLTESSIVTAALSLGPCNSQHILEELAVPITPENIQRVVEVLISHRFDRHGPFWFF